MTDPQHEAESLIGEAHEACPCRDVKCCRFDDGVECACCAAVWGDAESLPCLWPGHAAISAAILAAVKATREEDADLTRGMGHDHECEETIRTATLPSWCPKEKA